MGLIRTNARQHDAREKKSYNIVVTNSAQFPAFRKPSAVEALFNRAFGLLVGLGIAPSYMQLLQVRGRKTGRIYSSPVNLLQVGGKPYLVAPRGATQWVRNAEATGEIVLKRGSVRCKYRLRPVSDAEKLEILKLYLASYKSAVQRYFPVPAGSPAAAFRDIASNYPVFELIPE
jgi:deazaflavin-dependent oxidoreductase (nitroreductase family)